MRVITGTARGCKLSAVPGMVTRPTADKIKETIFNIIQFDIEGRNVLDLFAGTGQMGIEALSRGARDAVFVDMSAKAVKTIQENLSAAGIKEGFRVVGGEALSFIEGAGRRFDLVFLDPPYGTGLLEKTLKKIAEVDICVKDAIIVCEHSKGEELPELAVPYIKGREYVYGGTAVSMFRRSGE